MDNKSNFRKRVSCYENYNTFVVIITYRHHCDSTVAFFERIAPFFNIKLFILTCCTYIKDEQKDIPITMCQDQLEEAYQLGIEIYKRDSY